jgi:hypothetical protein
MLRVRAFFGVGYGNSSIITVMMIMMDDEDGVEIQRNDMIQFLV